MTSPQPVHTSGFRNGNTTEVTPTPLSLLTAHPLRLRRLSVAGRWRLRWHLGRAPQVELRTLRGRARHYHGRSTSRPAIGAPQLADGKVAFVESAAAVIAAGGVTGDHE